jgi:hypothetical protein
MTPHISEALRRARIGSVDAWRWRGEAVKRLDSDTNIAQARICAQVRASKVTDHPDVGRYAWGQFLDGFHHQPNQWGRFGTSAAVQVLAIGHRWEQYPGSVMARDPLDKLADILPTSAPATVEELERAYEDDDPDPRKHQDFRDPLKTAFVVEALDPDEDQVGQDHPLVEHLIGLSRDGELWNTSSYRDVDRTALDRLLATSYVLYVLRRYPNAHTHPRVIGSWAELAKAYNTDGGKVGEDLGALSCLALTEVDDATLDHMSPRQKETVVETRASVFADLEGWARDYREPVITRPYFNCYSRDDGHDYIFLSPELLTALLCLRRGSPKSTRGFVLRVVAGITANLGASDMRENERRDPRGFRIQRSMEGSVDQMWALRVLWAFHQQFMADPSQLRPARFDYFGPGPTAIAVALIGVAVAYPIGGVLVALVGAFAGGIIGAALAKYFPSGNR